MLFPRISFTNVRSCFDGLLTSRFTLRRAAEAFGEAGSTNDKPVILSLSAFDAPQANPERVDGSTPLTVDPELAEWVEGSKDDQTP